MPDASVHSAAPIARQMIGTHRDLEKADATRLRDRRRGRSNFRATAQPFLDFFNSAD